MSLKVALFYGTVSRISLAIEWFTRSKYCHAAIIQSDGSLIEAIEGVGVHRLPALPAGDTCDLFTVCGPSSLSEISVERFLGAQLGLPYANLDIVGFLTRCPEQKQAGAWFCSELVYAAIRAGGVELLARVEPFQVSPGSLAMSPYLEMLSPGP